MNKPFDRIVKSFVEEAPRMFLHVLAIVPLDAEAEVVQLSKETAPSIILPDYAAIVKVAGPAAIRLAYGI